MSDITNKKDTKNIEVYYEYIADRSKRITAALYRVTDLFSDKEPLKWYLRNEGIYIFKKISGIAFVQDKKRIDCIESIEKRVKNLFAILELSSFGSYISKTNFDVLEKEYRTLLSLIKDKKKELISGPFSEEIFIDLEKNFAYLKYPTGYPEERYRHKKQKEAENPRFKEGNEFESDKRSLKEEAGIAVNNNRGMIGDEFIKSKVNNQTRQDKIIELIRQKGEVGVGEIAVFFGDVSEKTIQRDLILLSDKGILQKRGDKRWRKYSILE